MPHGLRRSNRDRPRYSLNKAAPEIVYADVLEEARQRLGIETVYSLTDASRVPPGWQGGIGRVDAEMIAKAVPDYRERTFYLSGPRPLVVGFKKGVRNIGIPFWLPGDQDGALAAAAEVVPACPLIPALPCGQAWDNRRLS